jgi:tripartite-type tricarboxylate transporter receptor subunit TctC
LAQQATKDAAKSFPARPVRLVVPVPPGGSSDASARIIGQKLVDSWGHQVIIDNRAGAAEIIGTELTRAAGLPLPISSGATSP